MKKDNLITHFNVEEIKDPKFLKDLSYKELDVLSNDIRKEIIEVTSKTGGHLSSNVGVVELTIALHRNFDFLKDTLLFDVGHQCYTHKILTGRSIKNIRQDDRLCGFQKMQEQQIEFFASRASLFVVDLEICIYYYIS
jgi:1-deoxy-D-xylulose-5-phosphate synthase